MKKTVALLLIMIMCVSVLSGCFGTGSSVTGKAGAMLALANERLRGNFTGKNNLFGGAVEDLKNMADLGESFAESFKLLNNSNYTDADDIVSADRNNTQFNEAVMRSVSLAERGTEHITHMKERVRVLDTWVEIGNEKLLLHVEENSELLISEDKKYEESFVCYRTRDEKGIERYELLIDAKQTGYTMRALYIEDQVYDYMETYSTPGTDEEHYLGFSAVNVNGVWQCMENRYHYDSYGARFEFNHVILTDDLCFSAGLNPDSEVYGIYMSTSDRKVDIISAFEDDSTSYYLIQLGAFSGYKGIYDDGSRNQSIVLADDTRVQIPFESEELSIGRLLLMESAWGKECEIEVRMDQGTIDSRRAAVKNLLEGWGLECVEPLDNVFKKISEARAMAIDINRDATWNGESIHDTDGNFRALETEKAKFSTLVGYFEEYKDKEVIQASLFGGFSPLAQFAPITSASGNATAAADGRSFDLSGISATVEDLTLFSAGEEYYLAVGLQNSSGIIHLEGYERTLVKCEGESITLTLPSGTVDVSEIAPGSYDIVIYASTDDGIRSSKPHTVGAIVIK